MKIAINPTSDENPCYFAEKKFLSPNNSNQCNVSGSTPVHNFAFNGVKTTTTAMPTLPITVTMRIGRYQEYLSTICGR